VESGLGGNRRDTQKAQQFIEQQIQEYERKLQEAERRLKDFKLRNLDQMGQGNALEYISNLESQLATTKIDLRGSIQSRDALKRELAGEEPVLMGDPDLDANPRGGSTISVPEVDSRIGSLKSKLDELLRNYTEQHPDVVTTKRLIADLEKEREQVIEERRKAALTGKRSVARTFNPDRNPVYQQLKISLADAESKAAALKGKEDELQRRIDEVRARARLKPELEEELVQLNRDYNVQKSNFENLLSRRESAMMTGQLEQSASVADFRIIDPPRVSSKPVAPNRLLLLGAVVGVAIAAGAVASLAYSQLFPVFHSLKGLRKVLQRPVLGAVSMQDGPASRRRRRVSNFVFFGGLAGLFAAFATALVFLMFVVRAA